MDGILNYYKSKNKKEPRRCVIKLKNDENNSDSFSKFVIYNKDQKSIKKEIPFGAIKMISRYDDRSWEIITKSGYKFRYFDDNPHRNENWVRLLKGEPLEDESQNMIDSQSENDQSENSNDNNDQSESNNYNNDQSENNNDNNDHGQNDNDNYIENYSHSENESTSQEIEVVNNEVEPIQLDFSNINLDQGLEVKIDPDRTDNKFLNIFSLDYIYLFKSNPYELVLIDNENNKEYTFEFERIRRYGCLEDCFIFELGRNLEYGPGKISLKSVFSNTAELNNIIFDLITEKLTRLKEQIIEYSYANRISSKNSSKISLANENLDKILVEKTNLLTKEDGNDNRENSLSKTSSNPALINKPVDFVSNSREDISMKRTNSIEIPIMFVEDKKRSNSNNRILDRLNENVSTFDSNNSSQERIVFDNHNNRFEITMQNEYTTIKNSLQTDYKKILKTTNLAPNSTKTNIITSVPNTNNSASNTLLKKELKLLNEHPILDDDSDTSTLVETDESFYLDKYRPEYLNRKDQQQSDIFVDKDKSVYGRVKL